MKPSDGAEFLTIIYINYGISSLASCVSIENKHAPLLVYFSVQSQGQDQNIPFCKATLLSFVGYKFTIILYAQKCLGI